MNTLVCSANSFTRCYSSYLPIAANDPEVSPIGLHLHLADTFVQSDLQYIQVIGLHVLSVCVFPGNLTHNLLRC